MIELLETLSNRFDEGELRTLCYALGIDYDDLPAVGKRNKVRELLRYAERHGRLDDVFAAGDRLRPDIDWNHLQQVVRQAQAKRGSDNADWYREEAGERENEADGGGDVITIGDIGRGAAVAAGRGASASVHAGPSDDTLDDLFGPLFAALDKVSGERRDEAHEMATALRNEAAKGEGADDATMARLVEGMCYLAPGAAGAVTTLFADPALAAVAGPITRYEVDKLK